MYYPNTPKGEGTTPQRMEIGNDTRRNTVVFDTEGARCLRCGRRWNGMAQCDCNLRKTSQSPKKHFYSPYQVPTPRLLNLREGSRRIKNAEPRDEFNLPTSFKERTLRLQQTQKSPQRHPIMQLLINPTLSEHAETNQGGLRAPFQDDSPISPTLPFQAIVERESSPRKS